MSVKEVDFLHNLGTSPSEEAADEEDVLALSAK
eukprot:CAMPEP_0168203248 /NCGR_PEP_ID=MMETSP0139_2-20121125/24743_1 /TAXON_ID=44445 /ORGANISM="Pseudo-nitzschia australis, Strain 10249 10 AB" /LENGTH=32 /DNA_ID= /DNA_START= /DNA_END= /DNA_ORIENTATION=